MRSHPRALALATITAVMVIWGSTFIATKAAVAGIPPLTLAFVRFAIGALILTPVAARNHGLRRLFATVPLGRVALLAFAGVALFTAAFNYSLMYGSAMQGALIYALTPAAVAIAAVIGLGETLSRRRLAGIALSIAGAAVVVTQVRGVAGSPRPLLGAALMVVAVVAWAIYTVIAKGISGADQTSATAVMFILATAMLLPFAAVELALVPWPSPTLRAILATLFLGVVASGLAYVAYNYALQVLEASVVGAFVNLDPIVGVLLAFMLLGERLTPLQIAGTVAVLSGMWLAAGEGHLLARLSGENRRTHGGPGESATGCAGTEDPGRAQPQRPRQRQHGRDHRAG